MITLTKFIADVRWSTIEFTEEQLEAIYNLVSTEYATFEELQEDLDIDGSDTTYFSDIDLVAVIEYLKDLGDATTITKALTEIYGISGFIANIYYVGDEETYYLITNN